MRKSIIVFLSILLGACGGALTKTNVGIVEESSLIVVSDKLIGSTIKVGEDLNFKVKKDDLSKYKYGILGVKASEAGRLETVVIPLEKGQHKVFISNGNEIRFNSLIYLGEGQTRKIRIK